MQLKGKTVIVTGGSDGIGRHICLKLAAEGCRIAVLGRNPKRLDTVVAETLALGAAEARAYAVDLMDPAAIETGAQQILADFGGADILINNAGIWHKAGPLDSIDADMLVTTVQTNLTALMQLTRHVLPALRTRDEAAVLNVASKSGVVAQAGQSVYSATKYGVRGFTDVLKEDEAETGVRVAGLYQSGTNTGMFAKASEEVPNHIFTEPDDLADVVVFMLSRPAKLWMHEVRVEL
ncbi:SDR family oxidoreductase [Epibacterium ulvae]|uniref:SDR family oxidoreductase n=1 Tax=Epibacterium ulvae TaxID=1156985 RepID=UPI002490E162|nr:SDR family oxidoreductase [Epibacterium ulvae]